MYKRTGPYVCLCVCLSGAGFCHSRLLFMCCVWSARWAWSACGIKQTHTHATDRQTHAQAGSFSYSDIFHIPSCFTGPRGEFLQPAPWTMRSKCTSNCGRGHVTHLSDPDREKCRGHCDITRCEEMPRNQDGRMWQSFLHQAGYSRTARSASPSGGWQGNGHCSRSLGRFEQFYSTRICWTPPPSMFAQCKACHMSLDG